MGVCAGRSPRRRTVVATAGLTGVGNSFSILRLRVANLPDVVYLEQLAGAMLLGTPDECDPYEIAMTRLGMIAGKPGHTATELEKASRHNQLIAAAFG
jgi:hypothetical protein